MKTIKVALAIGIALLVPLLANMTVQIFRSPPESDSYYNYYNPEPKTAAERSTAEKDVRERNKRFESAQAEFNTFSFEITFPLGIAGLIGAYLLRRRGTVAAGLLFGSLSTVAFASYACWDTLPGAIRYVTLLFTLALLVVLALRIDRERSDVETPAPA